MNETVSLRSLLGIEEHRRSTDDVLAIAMPLLRQVADLHDRGLVAPLVAIDAVQAHRGRLFFSQALSKKPEHAPERLVPIEREERGPLQGVMVRGTPIPRPVHVTGFVSWEHEVGHHDPLTDIYVLGLILASLAIDEDLGDKDALERFAAAKRDVRRGNDRIHPVVARVIERMTDPRRKARLQDLHAIVHALEHHREQEVKGELDLEKIRGLVERTHQSRRSVICQHLRGRLFDLSRRNRLLYFYPSGQSLDLTEVSVPLVLDVKNISADALLTCTPSLVAELARMEAVALARWVRFEDYPFAQAALDKLRTTAARARAEYGFSSLKLALCFLHWHDLKKAPDERIHTPLLLLPVELTRKKGVRDTYVLQATADEAEVNPVLRQVLLQTYGIRLPEAVSLIDAGSLTALRDVLVQQIQASEPAVTVDTIERPAVELIHARARRRLDGFRKRAQISGRGVRERDGIEYSYRRDNFQPLGLRLFTMRVAVAEAPAATAFDAPRTRTRAIAPEAGVREIEKELYSRKRGADAGGPHRWGFDLTAVTLGNFAYQNMSLVRDYDTLLEHEVPNDPFDALFSTDARPLPEAAVALPAAEQFPVVAADATQMATVARARSGASFIVQGPPGTGKSQTITNLIADYVARGKRVLFVCEKRAAIDVVYHRLRQLGLDRLTALIHDSQTGKRAFAASLKESYETWIEGGGKAPDERQPALAALVGVTSELERFDAIMTAPPENAGEPLVSIIRRTFELDAAPAMSPSDMEKLPAHRDCVLARGELEALRRALASLGDDPVIARHPIRLLQDRVLFAEHPVELMTGAIARLRPALERARATGAFVRAGTPLPIATAIERASLAARIRPLASARRLALLDDAGDAYRALKKKLVALAARAKAAAEAAARAAAWKNPVPRTDLAAVVALSRKWHGKLWRFLFPSFWRLRRIVHGRFDFGASLVAPTYVEALALLATRYEAEDEVTREKQAIAGELGVEDLDETVSVVEAFHVRHDASAVERDFRRELLEPSAPAVVERLAAAAPALVELKRELDALFVGYETLAVDALATEIARLEQKLGAIPELARPLAALRSRAPAVASALRSLPLSPTMLEREVCEKTIDAALRAQPAAAALNGRSLALLRERLEGAHGAFLRANATHILKAAQAGFLEHVRLASTPAATLDGDEKTFKNDYAAGRRDLEHEIGKVTRFKSIRELMTGKTGLVIRDLKPVWLMSPLSVADTLPLSTDDFDVVIFDEASQIPLENAVPAIHRANQCIVVGDDKQLPPTDFFGSSPADDEAAVTFAERGENVSFDLEVDSLLAHAARTLPSTMLGWHYRSRDESLIQFSNHVFYDGKLATIPTPARVAPRAPIRASTAEAGESGAGALLERPISFHRLDGATYDARRNRLEASYIAHLVRALLARKTGQSLGIVAFSEGQQDEIEGALGRLADTDTDFRAALDAEMERTEDDQFCGLFVKNLENVQGDERDIIVLSICYGPDAQGRMKMNFGPINHPGGEKRLNVIFSRARHHLAVVSSIDDAHITNEYNDGANTLRCYLRYAAAMSRGDEAGARTALRAASRAMDRGERAEWDATVRALAGALRAKGFEVDEGVGSSSFRCDLAVRRKGETSHRLAILVDTEAHYAAPTDERHRVKPALLRAFGWRTEIVLAKDWREAPGEVLARVRRALNAE
ncbi:MAG: DUF4011 domain-containing protein [Polyangiaceae bacterium]|nr:DUF4011 domain-containing protein [Polyangiaceae bacterium]